MSKLDNLQQINTNSPRETLVYEADGLVVKRPTNRIVPGDWLAKQRHAQNVMGALKSVANPAYFVPQMLEISADKMFAIETRAYGHPISSAYFYKLSRDDQDRIYNAIAHLMNDINQSRPVLTQSQMFDNDNDATGNMPFKDVIEKMKQYIPADDLKIVTAAKEWFDAVAPNDASVVFSHGDMNENNIFYDPQRRVVSIIDFADARYENIHYMFECDFGKLGWLDLDRIRREYMALPRSQPVIIKSDKTISDMRILLQNFKWAAIDFLKKPTSATKIRLKMLGEDIAKIQNLYTNVRNTQQFNRGAKVIGAATGATRAAQQDGHTSR